MLVPPVVVRVSGPWAMRPTRITRLVMGFLLNAQVRGHPGCELTVRRGQQTLAPDGAGGDGEPRSGRVERQQPAKAGRPGRTGCGVAEG